MTQEYTRTNHERSEEIKADIERTRNEVGRKIDSIQERLSPEALRLQAQDTVQSALQDGADAVKEYFRTNSDNIRHTVVDSIKENPIPAALIGVGLGWMVIDAFSSSDSERADYSRSDWERRSNYAYGENYQPSRYGSTSRVYTQATGIAGSPTETGGYDPDFYTNDPTYQGEYQREQRYSGSASSQVSDQIRDVGSKVGEKSSQVAGEVASRVGEATQQAQEYVGEQASYIGEQAAYVGEQARHQMQKAGRQAHHVMEDNPLLMGATALAFGAVIGLMLPSTRREDRMMGEYRDRVVDEAQSVAEEVGQRAQKVVEEAKPEVEKLAKKVTADLKETGEEAKDAANRVATDAKAEAEKTQKEVADRVKEGTNPRSPNQA